MKDKLIKNYINKLTKSDIISFARKNDITLSDLEVDYIFYIIKNKYQEIMYGNPDNLFKELKNKTNPDNYNKIIKLFYIYKDKYQSFL